MDTGTIYRGQKMPDALRPQTAVRGVLHLSQLRRQELVCGAGTGCRAGNGCEK